MRIAQVCPKYYPALGGVEEVVKQYSERLTKRGYDVNVYTTDARFAPPWKELINNVSIHRSWKIPYPVLKPLAPAPLLPPKLALAKADIFHLHANKYFCTDTGALVAKLRRKPFVYQPHAGTFGSRLIGQLHNKTIGRLALSADVVVCVSEYERRLIEKSGAKVKRFGILPNGVDVKKYGSRIDRTVGEDNRPTVLFVGRLAPHKGLDILVEAAREVVKKIPEVNFGIIGPDAGERGELELRIENYGLEKHFSLSGRVSEGEKIWAYQNANVFCLPSRSEAFGIAIIEAMAADCPVVATDTQAIPEIVEDGETGLLFPVDDAKALADRLITVLEDKKSAKKMAEKASEVVREKYDWDIIVRRLEGIYQEIVKS